MLDHLEDLAGQFLVASPEEILAARRRVTLRRDLRCRLHRSLWPSLREMGEIEMSNLIRDLEPQS